MFRSFAFVSATLSGLFSKGVSNSAPSFKTNFYFPRPTPKIEYWSWQLLFLQELNHPVVIKAASSSLSEGRGCLWAVGIFHMRTSILWTQACSMRNHCHVFSGGQMLGFLSTFFLPSQSLPHNSVRLKSFLLPSHKVIKLSPFTSHFYKTIPILKSFYNLLSSSNNNSNNNIQVSAKRQKIINSPRLEKPSKIRIYH